MPAEFEEKAIDPRGIGELPPPSYAFGEAFHPFSPAQAKAAASILYNHLIERAFVAPDHFGRLTQPQRMTEDEAKEAFRKFTLETDWQAILTTEVVVGGIPMQLVADYIPQKVLELSKFFVPFLKGRRKSRFQADIDYIPELEEKAYRMAKAPLAFFFECNEPDVSLGYEITLPDYAEIIRGIFALNEDGDTVQEGIFYPPEPNGKATARLLLLPVVQKVLREMTIKFIKLDTPTREIGLRPTTSPSQ